jgi:hypothetical protein
VNPAHSPQEFDQPANNREEAQNTTPTQQTETQAHENEESSALIPQPKEGFNIDPTQIQHLKSQVKHYVDLIAPIIRKYSYPVVSSIGLLVFVPTILILGLSFTVLAIVLWMRNNTAEGEIKFLQDNQYKGGQWPNLISPATYARLTLWFTKTVTSGFWGLARIILSIPSSEKMGGAIFWAIGIIPQSIKPNDRTFLFGCMFIAYNIANASAPLLASIGIIQPNEPITQQPQSRPYESYGGTDTGGYTPSIPSRPFEGTDTPEIEPPTGPETFKPTSKVTSLNTVLSDGTYLFGNRNKPQQGGGTYFFFSVKGQQVTGAVYEYQSDILDCFHGTQKPGKLEVKTIDHNGVSHNEIGIINLNDYHPLKDFSSNDEAILQACQKRV